jgi:hypothetical protein
MRPLGSGSGFDPKRTMTSISEAASSEPVATPPVSRQSKLFDFTYELTYSGLY